MAVRLSWGAPFTQDDPAAYWLVEPDEPSLTVLHLSDGTDVEHAVARPARLLTG